MQTVVHMQRIQVDHHTLVQSYLDMLGSWQKKQELQQKELHMNCINPFYHNAGMSKNINSRQTIQAGRQKASMQHHSTRSAVRRSTTVKRVGDVRQ